MNHWKAWVMPKSKYSICGKETEIISVSFIFIDIFITNYCDNYSYLKLAFSFQMKLPCIFQL